MDWILTVIYFGYLVTQIMLVRNLYKELKENTLDKFAREASCYMFAIKLIIMLHIGLRIVFNTLSDSESRIQGNLTQQLSWHYILLGGAITEMCSAFGMMLLMTITFNFEESSIQLLLQEKCKPPYTLLLFIESGYAPEDYGNDDAEEGVEMVDNGGGQPLIN